MYNPDTAPYAPPLITSARATAARDVAVFECHTRNEREIEAAASLVGNEPHGGLLIIPEPFTNAHRDQIIAQSARSKLPTINPVMGAANRGALISYTFAFDVMMQQAVTYIDRILRGELPRNLPVQAPTKYVLSINLKVAKALGLTGPPMPLIKQRKRSTPMSTPSRGKPNFSAPSSKPAPTASSVTTRIKSTKKQSKGLLPRAHWVILDEPGTMFAIRRSGSAEKALNSLEIFTRPRTLTRDHFGGHFFVFQAGDRSRAASASSHARTGSG